MTGMTEDDAMPAPHDPLSLSRQLCFSVYAAGHAFNRVYKLLLGDLGLTYPQYLVMLVLWEDAADGEAPSVGRIGEHLGLDSGTLTPLLKRMQQAGLIVRRRDPQDERQVRVGLTAKGLALRERAQAVPRQIGLATGLDGDQVEAMRQELERLRASLEAFASDAASDPNRRSGKGASEGATRPQPRGV